LGQRPELSTGSRTGAWHFLVPGAASDGDLWTPVLSWENPNTGLCGERAFPQPHAPTGHLPCSFAFGFSLPLSLSARLLWVPFVGAWLYLLSLRPFHRDLLWLCVSVSEFLSLWFSLVCGLCLKVSVWSLPLFLCICLFLCCSVSSLLPSVPLPFSLSVFKRTHSFTSTKG
jgi:hypothetical protein